MENNSVIPGEFRWKIEFSPKSVDVSIKAGKKAGNTRTSQDSGKYWEFLGNTWIYWEIP